MDNPDKTKVPTLVKPESHEISEATTFYAVYTVGDHIIADHTSYIKGYPNGKFGPADSITRAEVATIIARSCLEDFKEGTEYGDGGYKDITGHWAKSAIAYCTQKKVFEGYDGMFEPNKAISRQEFALVFARLAGVVKAQSLPFRDQTSISAWALDGIYTAYSKGWINGYEDGTFLPLASIHRAEAVKIVNAYLVRGVDKAGLVDAKGYKTWPDVPEENWAYYHILEASNDHVFYFADDKQPPERWLAPDGK